MNSTGNNITIVGKHNCKCQNTLIVMNGSKLPSIFDLTSKQIVQNILLLIHLLRFGVEQSRTYWMTYFYLLSNINFTCLCVIVRLLKLSLNHYFFTAVIWFSSKFHCLQLYTALLFNSRHTWWQFYQDLCFCSFYVAAPLSMCSLCAPEVSSYVIAQAVPSVLRQRPRIADGELKFVDNGNSLLRLGWWQWTSALVFMWGWIHQLWCHKILVKINFDINFALIIGIPFQFCLVCWTFERLI